MNASLRDSEQLPKKKVGEPSNAGRQIIETTAYTKAVEKVGGARLVDEALNTIHEALRLKPYAFDKCENDHVSFRYAKTKRVGIIPPLVVVFTIGKDGSVYLEHVEEFEWISG